MLYAFTVAALLITLAEFGDKTQLLALALACKFRPLQVLVGIFFGSLGIFFISTVVGQLVGNLIPRFWLGIFSGVLFIGFGLWTFRGDKGDAEDASRATSLGPILATAAAFFLAELGDKTQIMSMTVAADPAAFLRTFGSVGPAISSALARAGITAVALSRADVFWGVWLGSTVGILIADGLAIILGVMLGKKLPERTMTIISGSIFLLFGVASLVTTLLSR